MKKDIHRSEVLDRYIGEWITVKFKDGKEETGYLNYEYGYYVLIGYQWNTKFRKSIVKEIKNDKRRM